MKFEEMHLLSSKHRALIEASDLCGCFFCLKTFKPTAIREWIDRGETAVCPSCGIDSVLPSRAVCLDKKLLMDMEAVWFNISRSKKELP